MSIDAMRDSAGLLDRSGGSGPSAALTAFAELRLELEREEYDGRRFARGLRR